MDNTSNLGVRELADMIVDIMTAQPSKYLVKADNPILEFQKKLRSDSFNILSADECAQKASGLFHRGELKKALDFLRMCGDLVAIGDHALPPCVPYIPEQDPTYTSKHLSTHPTDPVELLPTELMCAILSQLDVRTISRAEQASKKWHRFIFLFSFLFSLSSLTLLSRSLSLRSRSLFFPSRSLPPPTTSPGPPQLLKLVYARAT